MGDFREAVSLVADTATGTLSHRRFDDLPDVLSEGDLLVLMQNLRCLTRQIEILRETGVPV